MQRALLLCWLILMVQVVQAQTRVILEADTAVAGVNLPTLTRQYQPLDLLIDNLPASDRPNLVNVNFNHMNAERKALIAKGPGPRKGFYYNVTLLCQADGAVDLVLIQPFTDVNPAAIDTLMKRLGTYYGGPKRHFPLTMSRAYAARYANVFGKVEEPRKLRTGDSTISTLEAARATARPDTVRYVFFNQLDLTNVPDVVYRFPNLEELDLSKNDLTQLPARLITDLPRLQRLSVLYNQIGDDSVFIPRNDHLRALTLQGNRLTRIPAAVRNARKLESLWMGNNRLKELNVKAIRGLKQLADLNFYNAGLTSLPRQIRQLKRVRVMDLYYNELTTLPKQIGRMRRLEQLAVAHNKLTSLPPQLAKLKRLDTLYAHHNPLSALPDKLATCRSLRLLDLSYSRFSEFPAVLTYLNTLETIDLSGNNIQTLPASVTRLTNLKQLYLRSNPVTRDDAKIGPYAKVIDQLEANRTEVFY